MNLSFKQAALSDANRIWEILLQAIERRRKDGSNQWQDGYPNPEVIKKDIEKGIGYILKEDEITIAYTAILMNDEPVYADIQGKWITDSDFVVFHRVAIADSHLGKGLVQKMFEYIEEFARKNKIYSIKADTNFDNTAMLHIFKKSGYNYCGEVFFRGSARKAFEKVLE